MSVVAARRQDSTENEKLSGELIDLRSNVSDGLVFFDLPEGVWRIFAFVTETVEDHHLDPMNPDSVDVLINEVYETHYQHFAPYFGNVFKGFDIPGRAVVKGDATSPNIAAASILAKVTRDRMCIELDRQYPGYGIAKHKGYGTADHYKALAELGVPPIYRTKFLRSFYEKQGQ